MDKNALVLALYLPPESAPLIASWIDLYQVELKISKSRRSKLGDYRAPHRGRPHRISINYNLNPFSFLITVIHEFAHLTCWNKNQFAVRPHGEEWKAEFQDLMRPWLQKGIFPEEIHAGLLGYMNNPAASSCTDLSLMRVLEKYDQAHPDQLTLETIAHGTHFKIKDGRIFIKGGKLRKRYQCVESATKRIYLFNPLAKVAVLS